MSMNQTPPLTHPTLDQVVSCLSGYDPDALPVAQAQQIIRNFDDEARILLDKNDG